MASAALVSVDFAHHHVAVQLFLQHDGAQRAIQMLRHLADARPDLSHAIIPYDVAEMQALIEKP